MRGYYTEERLPDNVSSGGKSVWRLTMANQMKNLTGYDTITSVNQLFGLRIIF
jgi:hypothetical protein